jgi:hypothetical protein
MRSFTLVILQLGMLISTASLGLTSPILDSTNISKLVTPTKADITIDDDKEKKALAHAISGAYGVEGEGSQGGTRTEWNLEDCFHSKLDCHFRNAADEAQARKELEAVHGPLAAKYMNFGAEPEAPYKVKATCMVYLLARKYEWRCTKDGHPPRSYDDADATIKQGHYPRSDSPDGLFTRELIIPAIATLNKPCAQAIITKYNQTDFHTMSLDQKKTLLTDIIDCVYDSSTDAKAITARAPDDANTASPDATQRCSRELINNAYLATHWETLGTPSNQKFMWWMILTACLHQEPGMSFKLRSRHSPAKQQTCMKSVVQGWTGDMNTAKDEDALMHAMMECTTSSKTALATRDPEDFDPAKSQACSKKIAAGWTGDLYGFMLAVMRCINQP